MQKTVLLSFSAVATAAITAGRFVGMMTGAHCAAAAKALGVAQSNAAIGESVAVDICGTAIVEAGGAFAAGVELKSDANGKAIARAGAGELAGYAITASGGDGQKVEILLLF